MNCKDTHKHITDYLEGILGEQERSDMENHLAACSVCSDRVAFIRSSFQVIEIDKRVKTDSEFTASVMHKISSSVSSEKVFSLRTRLLSVASVAAIVLVAVFSGSFLARLATSGYDTEATSLFAEDINFEPIESFFLLKDQE